MYTVEVRVSTWANGLVPHTFLVITGPDGWEMVRGFEPNPNGQLIGDGAVVDNSGHPSDATTGPKPISEQQFENLLGYINETSLNPPQYNLPLGAQCTIWAVNGLAQAGIIPPIIAPGEALSGTPLGLLETLAWNPYTQKIGFELNELLNAARNWIAPPPPPRHPDPLVLDLDGDGIETVGLNGASSILFDHNADGIKTATGWVKGDDAFLVLDRNGNGSIDSGAELFGDATPFASGATAADGFAALRELDSNTDGVFDSQDARYADVQLWRDLDQDGVSDAGELMSLAAAGVASINLNPDATTIDLGNGNHQTLGASFVRTDGSSGSVGNLDLAANAFYREFATPIALTMAAQALPDIQGSGAVRDLREAASLSTTLATTAAGINGTLSAAQMRAQVDVLIGQWADTSTMQDGIAQAAAIGMKVFYMTPGTTQADIEAFSDLLGGTYRMNWEGISMQQMSVLKSRRWWDGERRSIGAAANDAVFEMMRKG